MGTFLGVLGIMALAALLLGLWFWLDARRTAVVLPPQPPPEHLRGDSLRA